MRWKYIPKKAVITESGDVSFIFSSLHRSFPQRSQLFSLFSYLVYGASRAEKWRSCAANKTSPCLVNLRKVKRGALRDFSLRHSLYFNQNSIPIVDFRLCIALRTLCVVYHIKKPAAVAAGTCKQMEWIQCASERRRGENWDKLKSVEVHQSIVGKYFRANNKSSKRERSRLVLA